MRSSLPAILLLGWFSITCGAAPAVAQTEPDAAALRARAVFKEFCHRCHSGPGSEGGDFDVLDAASLRDARVDDLPMLVAGKPDDSYLLKRVTLREMPPKEIPLQPTADDIAALRAWIQQGAVPYPEAQGRAFLAIRTTYEAMVSDLRKTSERDRPFRRYFSFENLYNNPGVQARDLRVYRAALSKAINSLTWKPRIVVPQAIDAAQTVFAIDLRDLDWDRGNLWQAILREYPYGLAYKQHPDMKLRELERELGELSGSPLPVVRADWFVAAATRPPLYHILLDIPEHARDLEQRLGVDAAENFRRDRLARGGFFPSGVSGQNRLVERHEAQFGAYWKSYDFKKGGDRGDLKRFPLGPESVGHPHPRQAFVHDGGELIFHLPNGLQGYMLVDGQDQRIDAGPIEVVGDALKTSGTNQIITGQSCMACHRAGVIPFRDQIRTGTTVGGEARAKVEALYPEATAMDELLKQDETRFVTALEKAIGPFLRVDDDRQKPLAEFTEPIGEFVRFYQLAPLDGRMVAAELGLESFDALVSQAGQQTLRDLGLGPILDGGKISRDDWEKRKGLSLMQRAARTLGATPFFVGL